MKVVGTTVCTPINPRKIEKELRPVKIVNGITPDDAGNITIPAVYLVTLNDANTFAQQPYSDILAAYQAGYAVQCDYRGYRLPLKAVMDDWCTFSGVVDATLMTVLVRTNGNTIIHEHSLAKTTDIPTQVSQLENDSGYLTEAPVSSVNGQTGDVIVPGPVEVKAEKQADGSYEATLKPVQIGTAINNGSTVYCRIGEKILQMAYKTPSRCVFSGIYDDHLYTVSISTTDVEVSDTPLTSGSGDTGNAVLFTPQELTSEQKAQARANIGALAEEDLSAVGGGEQWEKIYELTASENVYSVSLPVVGADYQYLRLKASILPWVIAEDKEYSGGSMLQGAMLYGHGTLTVKQIPYGQSGRYTAVEALFINKGENKFIPIIITSNGNAALNGGLLTFNPQAGDFAVSGSIRLTAWSSTNTYLLAEGSTFELWGVRK
jgi:hypothetical protein